MNNVVWAIFNGARKCDTVPRYQYDYGQILCFKGIPLPPTYEVHFSNASVGGSATTMLGTAEAGVQIPDTYLASGRPVFAWIFLHEGEDDGETVYSVTIPVVTRPAPTDDPPTPEEQSIVTQAIAALNSAVSHVDTVAEEVDADAASASESAESARLSAEAAAESAGNASTDATTAAEAAETATTAATNAAEYAQAAEESAESAAESAELAAQHANKAGYAWFDVDDETGEMVVTVADSLNTDVRFLVNEYTGDLEVLVV